MTIYLPVHWRAAVALLACARIGAIHSVVFAGFSAHALRDRIKDANSRVVITADEGRRGGKPMPLKAIVDDALSSPEVDVKHVLVLRRTDSEVVKKTHWTPGRDVWWDEEAARQSTECEPEVMNAEDPLFILYVSELCFVLLSCLCQEFNNSLSLFRPLGRLESRKASFIQRAVTLYKQPHPSSTYLTCILATVSPALLILVGSLATRT